MHRDFADWLRPATVDLRSEDLDKRWNAIESVVPSLDVPKALDLVRLYFGRRARQDKFLEDFRSAFKAVDSAFPMHGNDLELGILAGATIVHALGKRRGQIADCSALAMVTASFHRRGPGKRAFDLIEYATTYLAERSEGLRRLEEDLAIPTPNPWQKDQLETLSQVLSQGNLQLFGGEVVKGFKSMESALGKLAERTREAKNQLLRLQRRHEEESDILWWLFGGYSRDFEKSIASLTVPGVSIIVGKELADLTKLVPGPFAARAFLDKALSHVKGPSTSTIQDAVNDAPRDWRFKWFEKSKLIADDLSPVLLAIRASLATEGEEDWIPVFEKSAGIKANRKATMLDIAEQVYRECLLLRKGGESEA